MAAAICFLLAAPAAPLLPVLDAVRVGAGAMSVMAFVGAQMPMLLGSLRAWKDGMPRPQVPDQIRSRLIHSRFEVAEMACVSLCTRNPAPKAVTRTSLTIV